VTANVPARDPNAPAQPNTFSYVAIACGILAFVISWLIFGVLGIALGFVARWRRERRWKTGMIVAVVGMVLGLLSVLLL
jgi:dipeptide/tripeptide permease